MSKTILTTASTETTTDTATAAETPTAVETAAVTTADTTATTITTAPVDVVANLVSEHLSLYADLAVRPVMAPEQITEMCGHLVRALKMAYNTNRADLFRLILAMIKTNRKTFCADTHLYRGIALLPATDRNLWSQILLVFTSKVDGISVSLTGLKALTTPAVYTTLSAIYSSK